MKDVAGVYETAEIKEVIKGIRSAYYSITWVLDIAESGTFTLKEEKYRKFIESKKYAPLPIDGRVISGEWELGRDSIICRWSEFRAPAADLVSVDVSGYRGGEFRYSLIFDVQSTGSLVSGAIDASGGNSTQGEFNPDLFLLNSAYDLEGLRFKRVE